MNPVPAVNLYFIGHGSNRPPNLGRISYIKLPPCEANTRIEHNVHKGAYSYI